MTRDVPIVVSRVIDGDSFFCEDVDLGFDVHLERQSFRLARINAWELKDAKGLEAKAFFEDCLARAGGSAELRKFRSKRDKYRRWLCEIWANDCCVNDLLLDAGLAVPAYGLEEGE